MPDQESLAERLRELKVRDVEGVDEERIQRALAAKAGLAERIHSMADTPLGADDGLDLLRIDAQPPVPRRLDPEETAEASDPQGKRNFLAWFLGREETPEGSGPVTAIPALKDGWEEVESYPLDEGYSYVRIERSASTGEMLYRVIEPTLTDQERQILKFVEEALVRGLDVDPSLLSPDGRAEYLEKAMMQILHDYRVRVDRRGLERVAYFLRRDFLGLGPIQPLMVDSDLEDISCDGPGVPLFVFHRRYESVPSSLVFQNDTELDGYVIRLAQRSGRAISISDPILDAALPDGSRLQATLGHEVTQNGSTFTIRRFKPDPFTALDLLRFGTLTPDMLTWFWFNVQHGQSLVFSGGTASGKTTSLNALAQFIPPQAKIVSIEDTREVNLPHQNWIKAVTRGGSRGEGTGEIGMFELLKASLRQRPEYILVGEVRGVEATVAFQAMATGHTVYSTLHADSARSVVYRLENEPINVPRLVLQALDIIAIQAQKRYQGKRVRRVVEVVELVGIDPSTRELLTNTVYRWDPADDSFRFGGRSYLLDQIASARNWSAEEMQAEFLRRRRLLVRMAEMQEQEEPVSLTGIVQTYYRDPEEAMRRVGL